MEVDVDVQAEAEAEAEAEMEMDSQLVVKSARCSALDRILHLSTAGVASLDC
jgi:hypothetical protein